MNKVADKYSKNSKLPQSESTHKMEKICTCGDLTPKMRVTPKMRANSASNGAFLPGKTAENIGESMKHSGRHPGSYMEEVFKRLEGATGKDEAVKRLNDIRNDLVSGSWSKEAWGKIKK